MGGQYCAVLNCNNNKVSKPDTTFFTFPKDMKTAQKWLKFSGRHDLDLGSKEYHICSEHFSEDQFRCKYPRRLLVRGSVPHISGPGPISNVTEKNDEENIPIAPTHEGPEPHIARVCSVHFEKQCFEIPLKHRLLDYAPSNHRNLRAHAVPTINIPGRLQEKDDEGRSLRAAKRSIRMKVENILSSESTSQISQSEDCSNRLEEPEILLEIEDKQLHIENESEVNLLKKRIKELERENSEQKEIIKNQEAIIKQYKEAWQKNNKNYELIEW